jgi:hypothetical protein
VLKRSTASRTHGAMEKAGTMSAAGYARPAVKMFITIGGLPRRDLLARKLTAGRLKTVRHTNINSEKECWLPYSPS